MTQSYEFAPDFDRPQNAHHIQMMFAPDTGTILDLGCHTGQFGVELMRRKDVRVIGADNNSEAVAVARTRLADAFVVDLENDQWSDDVRSRYPSGFDAIIFGDVLEHTRNPEKILRQTAALLKHDGSVIVSIPNIAHWRVRFGLLFGRFDYADSGILDRTHLRFFTRQSSRALLERAGYRIERSDTAGYNLPHWVIRLLPSLLGIQFVYKAAPIHNFYENT